MKRLLGKLETRQKRAKRRRNQALWQNVKCKTCGTAFQRKKSSLRRGGARFCGVTCLKPHLATVRTTHGLCKTREYRAWAAMRNRCSNPTTPGYKNYGSRGIRVCVRWNKFENFYKDMGNRAPGTSLDRINNNGNYEPKNCRWATHVEQSNNKRTNKVHKVFNITLTAREWERCFNLVAGTIRSRMQDGWDIYGALSTPVAKYSPRLAKTNTENA